MGVITARYTSGNKANSSSQSKAATAGRRSHGGDDVEVAWACLSAREREREMGPLVSISEGLFLSEK